MMYAVCPISGSAARVRGLLTTDSGRIAFFVGSSSTAFAAMAAIGVDVVRVGDAPPASLDAPRRPISLRLTTTRERASRAMQADRSIGKNLKNLSCRIVRLMSIAFLYVRLWL